MAAEMTLVPEEFHFGGLPFPEVPTPGVTPLERDM
jgi:hypothetical protein